MAFEPATFTPEQIAAAKNLFAQPCNFVLGVAKLEQLPVDGLPKLPLSAALMSENPV